MGLSTSKFVVIDDMMENTTYLSKLAILPYTLLINTVEKGYMQYTLHTTCVTQVQYNSMSHLTYLPTQDTFISVINQQETVNKAMHAHRSVLQAISGQ